MVFPSIRAPKFYTTEENREAALCKFTNEWQKISAPGGEPIFIRKTQGN